MHNWRYKINAKANAPMTNSNTLKRSQSSDLPSYVSVPHSRGEIHYHNWVFYAHPNNVYTSHCRFSTLTEQRSLLTLGFLVHRKLHNTLGFLAHRKPYNTHNVTNINLFSTIDENTMKNNSMLQSLTTLIYYVCKYNKLKWVCVTMR